VTENRASVLVSAAVLLASAPWFSGTAVAPHLAAEWQLGARGAASITSAVQLGFVVGTFLYAFLNLADIFNARRVFFVSALAAGASNLAFAWLAAALPGALSFRFLTGLFLAGVYPVGMRIVASWFRTGLGWRLGLLVGALTLGTASPFLIRGVAGDLDWRLVASAASVSAVAGAVVPLMMRDGPHLQRRARFDAAMLFKVFRIAPFRQAALSYFGHMWELYAFWSLLPAYLTARFAASEWHGTVPVVVFLVIAMGALGCVGGGWISRTVGERRVALVSLVASALLCALSGFAYDLPPALLIAYVLVWGVVVVSDSPQFSALSARACPPEYTATALTVQNGIGFAITIASIQFLPIAAGWVGWQWVFVCLAPGPALGAWILRRQSPAR
jgi:MFS family permease